MQSDHDLNAMGSPVVGKHFDAYQQHVRVVRLNEALARRFTTEQSVLEAFESVADGGADGASG